MTNEEAIKIISQYDVNFYWTDGEPIPAEKLMDAFEKAIEALKAQDVPDMNVGDMVYRQDAIDAVGSMLRRKFGIGGDLAEITIAGLPSAEPERQTLHWISCNEKYPDVNERVIIHTCADEYHVWSYMHNNHNNYEYYFWIDEYGFYHHLQEVSEWMPLLKSHKEVKNDK